MKPLRMKTAMNIVCDLLPWEPLFWISSAGFVGVGITALFRLLRRRSIGPVQRVLLSVCAVGMIAPWLLARNFGERLALAGTSNHVDTATGVPSELQPRQYEAPLQSVSEAVLASLDHLGWDVVYRDETTFEVEIPVARIGLFIDDMKVTLSENNGITTVNVQSHSRVGRGDLGENRRHVMQLFTVLDQKLERTA